MDKCPYCGAETRQGDNFCLNCGNRLLTTTPSSSAQQAQGGEATLATPDEWNAAAQSAAPVNWVDPVAPTVNVPSSGSEMPTLRDSAAPIAQATLDRIEEPARFILRADTGEVLQEYPLDKPEITIGRAPNSDILLSKDKLTSRRHATVRYEQNHYFLYDEHSANGTFVNAQQIDDTVPYALQDGDHVGIGEHELVYRIFGAAANPRSADDLPTIPVPQELTFRTNQDPMATFQNTQTSDEFGTEHDPDASDVNAPISESVPEAIYESPIYEPIFVAPQESEPFSAPYEEPVAPLTSNPVPEKTALAPSTPPVRLASSGEKADAHMTFNHFNNFSQPALPDASALVAALAALDGQVKDLQDQMNATQDAMRGHESDILDTANQLRAGIGRVSERMDSTIADVARSREALAWTELLQLMEDVMNNPRDIEYVTKLARKARELNKVFQIHQNVLNTMAECNSLLRSMISQEK